MEESHFNISGRHRGSWAAELINKRGSFWNSGRTERQMTFTSVSDVSEQIRTGLRHSCRSIPPLGWANNNIWCWYNGESRHTWPLLKAILLHVPLATVPPGHTWHTASVNRPVCTEEDITASPHTETPARPPAWLEGGEGKRHLSWTGGLADPWTLQDR